MTKKKIVQIYTDGACSGNPGPGGWGAVLIYKKQEKEIYGNKEVTTNNQMELTAAIEALKLLKESCFVKVYSDSSYLVRAFNDGWLDKWRKNGWMNAGKKPVENKELWEQLVELNDIHEIQWIKVKGHADNEYNNRCDILARNAIIR